MRIKALSRNAASQQTPGSSAPRQAVNLDPVLHPFERAREYTRALNATKLERMFAKPLVCQVGEGHTDGVYVLAKDSTSLSRLASGSGDGVVKVWNLNEREQIWQSRAHSNIVKGLCWSIDQKLLSCGGVDRSIALHDPYKSPSNSDAIAVHQGKRPFTHLSHHQTEHLFAASSSTGISIFDVARGLSQPVQDLAWPASIDTVNTVAFNPIETSILASAATDRSIALYDLRTSSPLLRTSLSLVTNAISWNPMEAFNLAAANEDHNIYLFDTRYMTKALNILRHHVAAVMDVDFGPTGERLVSASYDRTVRIWTRTRGHSDDVYHTKRMQRVFSARYSQDNGYVLSGSDDGNIRLWRAEASSRTGSMSAKQRQSIEYQSALKERYQHMPEIKRISRHRHIPKSIKKASEIKNEELSALKRRSKNRAQHMGIDKGTRKGEREKVIVSND